MTPRQRLALLDKLVRSHDLAHSAYTRYSQRPATETGRKAHARWEHYTQQMQEQYDQLRADLESDVE